MDVHHVPVLFDECLNFLVVDKSGIYFDATLGFGGHTKGILDRLDSEGKVVAADIDLDAFNYSKNKFENDSRVSLYNFNFSFVDVITKTESIEFFDGIIADLGVSSFQLDNKESGFTYRSEAKLDLRMDKKISLTAADVLNTFSEEDIANIIYKFGEEKNSRKIARLIVQRRSIKKISTTSELSEMISELVPPNFRIKTLSRVFQALRIFVNDELGCLKSFLENSTKVLKPGGRLVVISYHSLEDRIVKDFFKDQSTSSIDPKLDPVGLIKKEVKLKIITKKPVTPGTEEINRNFRARSAKLRVAERV